MTLKLWLKTFQQTKVQDQMALKGEFYQTFKELVPILNLFQKTEKEGTLNKLI